jgi:aminopeptidase N
MQGAEVIRMYETILGRDGFRKGMDLYFQRHDGCAVTCDDFLLAMADANQADLSALSRWCAPQPHLHAPAVLLSLSHARGFGACVHVRFPCIYFQAALGLCTLVAQGGACRYGQAGTPELTVSTSYDAAAKTFTITTRQRTPPTPEQPDKIPVLIPIKVGLLGPDGAEMPFTVTTGQFARHEGNTSAVLMADAEHNMFVLSGVEAKPVPSLLRDFSAPVKMTVEDQSEDELVFMMANDTDAFNRCAVDEDALRRIVIACSICWDDESCSSPGPRELGRLAVIVDSK